jgi:hypothetical protein
MNKRARRWIVLSLVTLAIATAACRPRRTSPPGPPTIDAVMRVPPTGLPVLVPQSLGGEYRALPGVPNVAARVAFDLRDLADVSQLEVFVDGFAATRGDTGATLAAGDPSRFSVVTDSYGARLVVLLAPLHGASVRVRSTISIASAAGGTRRTILVDTPGNARSIRPEASDVFFRPGTTDYYWWQPIYSGVLDEGNVVAHDVLLGGWLLAKGSTFSFDATGALPMPAPLAVNRNCLRPHGDYCEDLHYYLMLDPSFLARTYSRPDRTTSLSLARLPGVSAHGDRDPFPPAATDSVGGFRGAPNAVTINSFGLHFGTCGFHTGLLDEPWNSLACLKGEQPTWHVSTTPPTSATYFGAHVKGLGSPPAGWSRVPTEPAYDPETWYAFSPQGGIDMFTRADQTSRALRFGDYVVVKATLYEDGPHGYPAPSCFPRSIWHDGWLEFHSIDWIAAVPPPARVSTAAQISDCEFKGGSPKLIDREVGPPPGWLLTRRAGDTLHHCLQVDERFSTPGFISGLSVSSGTQPDKLRVRATLNPTATQNAALTASVVMWWAAASDTTLDVACHGVPSS